METIFFDLTEILGGCLFGLVLLIGAIQLIWPPKEELKNY